LDIVYYYEKAAKTVCFGREITIILKALVDEYMFFPILGRKVLKSSRSSKLAMSKRTSEILLIIVLKPSIPGWAKLKLVG
jgi:hypothetical protein